MQKKLLFNLTDEIALVTINRPEVRNALDKETRTLLKSTLEKINDDENIRVCIITGAGNKVFVSGEDISGFVDQTPLSYMEYSYEFINGLYNFIENMRIPVIAAINGHAVGGGTALAMACDIRVSSEKALFGVPEVRLGIIPGGGITQRLCQFVGKGRARKMILTAEILDAKKALEIGLIDEVVPVDKVLERSKEIAKEIIKKGPVAIRMAKAAINQGTPVNVGLDYNILAGSICFSTNQPAEGAKAFLEKRDPNWIK